MRPKLIPPVIKISQNLEMDQRLKRLRVLRIKKGPKLGKVIAFINLSMTLGMRFRVEVQ